MNFAIKMLFDCENAVVVYSVNTMTPKSDMVMTLLKALNFKCLLLNIVAKAKHIPRKFNITICLAYSSTSSAGWHYKQRKSLGLFRARFGTQSI